MAKPKDRAAAVARKLVRPAVNWDLFNAALNTLGGYPEQRAAIRVLLKVNLISMYWLEIVERRIDKREKARRGIR